MTSQGPLTRARRTGRRYILTVQDGFTRWLEAFALPAATAKHTVEVLVREIFCRYGQPESIHSDNGSTFTANITRDVCEVLGIKQSFTVPYNPRQRCNPEPL